MLDEVNNMKLVEITPDNYKQARALALHPEQENFVAPVIESLADAYVFKAAEFRLAVHEEQVIGYTVIFPFEADGKQVVNIVRMMIDKGWQGQGFGRKLLQTVLDRIAHLRPCARPHPYLSTS